MGRLVIRIITSQNECVSGIRSKRPKFLLFSEYCLYRCFERVLQCMPARWVDGIGMTLGIAAFHFMRKRRSIVERNLRIAWGDQFTSQELEILTKKVFQHNGANLLGGTRCMLMNDSALAQRFSLEGAELVIQHLSTKQSGAIFALCHMGNWEILARIAHLIAPGVPAGAFYRPLNNPWMNRMTKHRRQASGTRLFSNKEGLSQASPLLRSGGVLGILSDQHAGRTGCLCTFFGRPTSCSPLVELLHRRTGAAVFYVSMVRDAPAHWQIKITSHDSNKTVGTPEVIRHLEDTLSLSPADGFWFHNRWKQPKRSPLQPQHSRSCLVPSSVTKPWRWLIVESFDSSIALAARPAIRQAVTQSSQAEITLLSPHLPDFTCIHRQTHANVNLAHFIAEIDREKPYPIDVLLWIAPTDAKMFRNLETCIPVIAAITSTETEHVTHRIPQSGPLDEEATWWEFFHQLGIHRIGETDDSKLFTPILS
ncbi:MAG: lysophospholipid acyltransferase family protein [Akkermansiaceae bacterium]